MCVVFFFFQAEDGIRDSSVTGVQTCALPICFSCEEFALRDVGRVPYLFGNQAARSRGIFHHAQQSFGGSGASSGQFIVGSFTREKRPGAANPRAVKGGAVLLLSLAAAVVAVPARTLGKLYAQQFVDDL